MPSALAHPTPALNEIKQRFLARALLALTGLTENLPEESLAHAVESTNDYRVLLRALEEPDAIELLRVDDPLAPARLRGANARASLLEREGGTVNAAEAASLLGLTRQAVDKRRSSGKLLALVTGRRGYAYPAWQFHNGSTLTGLEDVLTALSGHDSWMQIAFFLNGHTLLDGRTPLAVLREGRVSDVLAAARSYGEHTSL